MNSEPMPYKMLEDIAIADIAFEATGKTLEEVFESCANAFSDISANVKKIQPKVKKEIKVQAETMEDLLYNFLSELIYLKDVEQLLFAKYEVKINRTKNYQLEAVAYGQNLNEIKSELRDDIKAVTLHMFEVRRTEKGWRAQVILDI